MGMHPLAGDRGRASYPSLATAHARRPVCLSPTQGERYGGRRDEVQPALQAGETLESSTSDKGRFLAR
jgi:hypothetical protein